MVKVVQQQGAEDCGVAALAMILSGVGLDYETIAAKAPRGGQKGLRVRELVETAAQFGLTLTPLRSYDLDTDGGILRVRSDAHHRDGHYVVCAFGVIIDPATGTVCPWQDYQRHYSARFGTLARL